MITLTKAQRAFLRAAELLQSRATCSPLIVSKAKASLARELGINQSELEITGANS